MRYFNGVTRTCIAMNNNLFVLHLIAMAFYVVNLNACTHSVKFKWKLILQMIEIFLPSIFVQFAFLFNYTKFWVNKMAIHIFKKSVYKSIGHLNIQKMDNLYQVISWWCWLSIQLHHLTNARHAQQIGSSNLLGNKIGFSTAYKFYSVNKSARSNEKQKMIAIRFIFRQKFAN